MSSVSGLSGKGEKGKTKYPALDINSLYKGKSLDNPKTVAAPKHGLQLLGKVGSGRRMPPPANLPSLKSENSGNNPNVSLVPSGGQGWGTSKEKTEDGSTTSQSAQQPPPSTQAATQASVPTLSHSQGTTQRAGAPVASSGGLPVALSTPPVTSVASGGMGRSWSSVMSSVEDGGPERNYLAHQSPFFPQEFPKLAGGDGPTSAAASSVSLGAEGAVSTTPQQRPAPETQYGPGPSLRPQTEGSWARGTLQQQAVVAGAGGQQPNSGSGVNGQEQGGLPRGSYAPPPPTGAAPGGRPPMTANNGGAPPLGHPPPQQYRGMMPNYMVPRNFNFSPSFGGMPPQVARQPQQQQGPPQQQSYPGYSDNRIRSGPPPPPRHLKEDEAYQRQAAIITEKDLKGFDDILQNNNQDGWASAHSEIDYEAKLVFSDDEESSSGNRNKDKSGKRAKDQEERISDLGERAREESSSAGKREKQKASNRDWELEGRRSEQFDREENRRKNWNPAPSQVRLTDLPQQRTGQQPGWQSHHGGPMPPSVSPQSPHGPAQAGRIPFDYRSGQSQNSGYPNMPATPPPPAHMRIPQSQQVAQSRPLPLQNMGNPAQQPSTPPRPGEAVDEELWQKRRRQQSDEMNLTVERARQLRVEEEKRFKEKMEKPPQIPQQRNSVEDKTIENDSPDAPPIEERDRSRHSSESREDKIPRQNRSNQQGPFQGGYGNFQRPYKNVPPRFQKQQEMIRAQQHQQQYARQVPGGPQGQGGPSMTPYDPHWGNMPSIPPYVAAQMSGPGNKTLNRSRSDSQGSAGLENYEGEQRRTPDQHHGPMAPPHHGQPQMPAFEHSHSWMWERKGPPIGSATDFKKVPDKEEQELEFDEHGYRDRALAMTGYEEKGYSGGPPEPENWSAKEYGSRPRNAGSFEEAQPAQSNEKWEKDRPDSRDSRNSRESFRDDRPSVQRQESQGSTHSAGKERRGPNSKLQHGEAPAKERTPPPSTDWADSPYPLETTTKRRTDWCSASPATPQESEKKFTPLKRNTLSGSHAAAAAEGTGKEAGDKKRNGNQNSPVCDGKDSFLCKDEKNERNLEAQDVKDRHSVSPDGKKMEESLRDKKEQSKVIDAKEGKDRRRGGRDRGGGGGGGSGGGGGNRAPQPRGNSGAGTGGNRYDSSRKEAGSRGASAGYSTGGGRGRSREYRRTKTAERGPRFEKSGKEKGKNDKRDNSSGSEENGKKPNRLRQKDEDSELSVDEVSASTTDSAQLNKPLTECKASGDSKENRRNEKLSKDKKETRKTEEESKGKDCDKGAFLPRGEPSRRGRGGGPVSFSRSSRGASVRYNTYGPPPSKAAFGSGKAFNKSENSDDTIDAKGNDFLDKKESDQATNQHNAATQQGSNSLPENVQLNNTFRSGDKFSSKKQYRYDNVPPRFQKRQPRRFEGSGLPNEGNYHRGRGGGGGRGIRGNGGGGGGGRSSRSGGGMAGSPGNPNKENLSDVANEEWETASESSDIGERRGVPKDDKMKKDKSPGVKKSFSGQRPSGDHQNRRPPYRNEGASGSSYEGSRGGHRDNRRSGGEKWSGSANRASSGNNQYRHPNPVGQQYQGGSNYRGSRNGNALPGQGMQRPGGSTKNENQVYRVSDIKYDEPAAITAAFTDLHNRKNMKRNEQSPKAPKPEKEKVNTLEGYDLNNYASVVIIDDQPQVTTDDPELVCDSENGFQEVTSKKRHKVMNENEVKKLKKENVNGVSNRVKGNSRSRPKLAPRFAKKRESNRMGGKGNEAPNSPAQSNGNAPANNFQLERPAATDNVASLSASKPVAFNIKDTAPPPPINAWDKPLQSQANSSSGPVKTSATCLQQELQAALTVSSKSSSFDRSDQHDSGIDVSDQPASTASSQRSSPSNDCKAAMPPASAPTVASGKVGIPGLGESELNSDLSKLGTVIFENKNFKAENAVLDKFGNNKIKEVVSSPVLTAVNTAMSEGKPCLEAEKPKTLQLPVTFAKDPFGKNDDSTDMKLDFTFDSELERLTEEKAAPSGPNTVTPNGKQMAIGRSAMHAGAVQSLASPSTDDLNMKIASVKKVWETSSVMPTVVEHAPAVSSGATAAESIDSTSNSATYSTFSATVESSGYSDSALEGSSISFGDSVRSNQSKTPILGPENVHKMRPQQMMHTSSPPPQNSIRTIASLANSVQVAGGIPAIPSPPTVLYNSSQPMAQTGLYQTMQMENSQVMSQPTRAVLAAISQFTQPPPPYTNLGAFGLSHQASSAAQLPGVLGQPNIFMQPRHGPPPTSAGHPSAPDLFSSSNQFRVSGYGQPQHVTNQVLTQQNLQNSHMLGSQLVPSRPGQGNAGSGPSNYSLQAVPHSSQTSYYSASGQTNYYHHQQAAAGTPGSPLQQQHYSSLQGYGSQNSLSLMAGNSTGMAHNFRGFAGPHFKSAGAQLMTGMETPNVALHSVQQQRSMVDSATLSNKNIYSGGTGAVGSVPVSTQYSSNTKMAANMLQSQAGSNLNNARMSGSFAGAKGPSTGYGMSAQGAQFNYGQAKFTQQACVRPPMVVQGMVRHHHSNPPLSASHYPAPIQRPGTQGVMVTHSGNPIQQHQTVTAQPPGQAGLGHQRLGNRTQLSTAQQAKMRAEAVQQTQMFFTQTSVSGLAKDESLSANQAGDKIDKMEDGLKNVDSSKAMEATGSKQLIDSAGSATSGIQLCDNMQNID